MKRPEIDFGEIEYHGPGCAMLTLQIIDYDETEHYHQYRYSRLGSAKRAADRICALYGIVPRYLEDTKSIPRCYNLSGTASWDGWSA